MQMQLARRRIHEHRIRLGLSPDQYGLRIGVSGATVRRVEQGYVPFLSTQAKFAKAVVGKDATPPDLFGMPSLPGKSARERVAA